MDYQSALEYLNSFVNLEVKPAELYAPERFNLKRVLRLLDHLGNPHYRYTNVHIAGTKGKGSLAAMVESVLRAAGYCTGLFTSPHLQNFSERIQVVRKMIPHNSLAALVTELRSHIDSTTDITFYEISTVLALEWFARQGVDIAVIEVGLGGRLDATNVIAPSVCAITPISFDHVELLGNTIESIAGEKAGIIKSRVPIVVAPQTDAAHSILQQRANTVGAPLIDVGAEWAWRYDRCTTSEQQLYLWPNDRPQEECIYRLPLIGAHQADNAAVAVALIQQLREQGWSISPRAISQGLQTVQWTARCEVLDDKPPVMLDCAHNRASAKALVETLQDYFPGVPQVLVFGAMCDKDVSGMFAELLPGCSSAIMTTTNEPRAMRPRDLVQAAEKYNCPISESMDIISAVNQAKITAMPAGIVVVTGSVALAGMAQATLKRSSTLPTAEPL